MPAAMFDATEEQRLLGESVARFVARRHGKHRAAEGDGADAWREMAELGWLGLLVPEADGGLGMGAAEAAIIAEGLGRGLVTEPFLPSAVVAASLVAALGDPAQRGTVLPGIVNGSIVATLAHGGRRARLGAPAIATRAEPDGDGWRLEGEKDTVLAAGRASLFLVTAHAPGCGPDDVGMWLVPRTAAGLAVQDFALVGGGDAGRLHLDGVRLEAGARLGSSTVAAVLDAALDLACVVLAAEAVGCMAALMEATTGYTGLRQQFGQTLASNQVVRHRLADMAIACTEVRALARRAALAMAAAPAERARAASAVRAKLGRAGRLVAEQSVQLHGAMGVTDELNIGDYFKRLLAIELLFGTPAEHLSRHAALRAVVATGTEREQP